MIELISNIYPAARVLRVAETTPKAGVTFLNFSIKPALVNDRAATAQQFRGAGLYAVLFRGLLVYIGSFLGGRDDTFGSNVVNARWWAHFGTLTNRGSLVSVQPGLLDTVGAPAGGSALFEALRAGQPGVARKEGCEASVNRLRFANVHWDFFSTAAPEMALESFAFIYVQVARATPLSLSQLRSRIECAEVRSIQEAQPTANGRHRDMSRPCLALSVNDTTQLLARHLHACVQAEPIGEEPTRSPASDMRRRTAAADARRPNEGNLPAAVTETAAQVQLQPPAGDGMDAIWLVAQTGAFGEPLMRADRVLALRRGGVKWADVTPRRGMTRIYCTVRPATARAVLPEFQAIEGEPWGASTLSTAVDVPHAAACHALEMLYGALP